MSDYDKDGHQLESPLQYVDFVDKMSVFYWYSAWTVIACLAFFAFDSGLYLYKGYKISPFRLIATGLILILDGIRLIYFFSYGVEIFAKC